jgi:hypothetical protein
LSTAEACTDYELYSTTFILECDRTYNKTEIEILNKDEIALDKCKNVIRAKTSEGKNKFYHILFI